MPLGFSAAPLRRHPGSTSPAHGTFQRAVSRALGWVFPGRLRGAGSPRLHVQGWVREPPGGTCGGGSTGPAVRSLPAGLQGSRDFNWSLNQHSSASSPAWWGPPHPAPARRDNPQDKC